MGLQFLLTNLTLLTKIVIPFFVRNYSTHFVSEYKKNKFFQKIAGFFRKSKNTAAEAMDEMDAAMQEAKQSASNMT